MGAFFVFRQHDVVAVFPKGGKVLIILIPPLSHLQTNIFAGFVDRGDVNVLTDYAECFLIAAAVENLFRHFGRFRRHTVSFQSFRRDQSNNSEQPLLYGNMFLLFGSGAVEKARRDRNEPGTSRALCSHPPRSVGSRVLCAYFRCSY
mgnify:CR=1 FL=1